jgi:LPXTG-site transpeptidase (sortase) family protein
MRESMMTLWRNASPLKRVLLAGVPAIVLALSAAGVIYAGLSEGGDSNQQDVQAPATTSVVVATQAPATTPQPTEPPVSAGLQATTPSAGSSSGGSQAAANTGGSDTPRYQAPAAPQSGPGAEQGTSWSLSIPAIGVNASVYSRTIGGDGQMGNPSGPYDVVWYDFAAEGWTGLGGEPGQPGANAVMAGHVDYIHVGPAVFWSIRDLQPGDIVTVNTPSGPINYSVQWSQWAEPDQDFTGFVAQTGQESITLVTCIGSFSAGHYSNRFVVRGVRV